MKRSGPAMQTPSSIAFHTFSPQGTALGRKLAKAMKGTLFVPARLIQKLPFEQNDAGEPESIQTFESLADLMADCFHGYAAHVFIGAAGIAVRAIAPHLHGKTVDPAVVVCEIHGRYVISLLSGHVGGANALARNLAELTGGLAVVTTATDSEGLPALDVLADIAHCRVADPLALKLVTSALLAGHQPALLDPAHILDLSTGDRARLFRETGVLPLSTADSLEPAAVVSLRTIPPAPGRLRLYARRLRVGLGYRKGVPADALLAALRQVLKSAGLAEEAIASVATATIKKNDPAIREVARLLDAPLHFFSAAELAAVPVPHPSPKAQEILGCGPVSVSEGAALLPPPARLIVPKQILEGVTVAVALPCGSTNSEIF